jgi:CNT family concentrative nucleoside transporter
MLRGEPLLLIVQGLFGLVVLTGFCWAISENRRAPFVKIALAGLAMQFVLAALFLKVPIFKQLFLWLNSAVGALNEATRIGTSFVFGYIGGGPLPFTESFPGASFVLAFQALPLILVMSALSAVLFHWRVLPLIVKGFAWVLHRTLNVGGAVGVSAAANVFVGQIEAPLFIRPYLASLSRSEMFMVMTGGMATIAGTVMVLYATFLTGIVPDPLGHILIASIVSTPAAIMVARLMVPDDGGTTAGGETPMLSEDRSTIDAITRGTLDGIGLLLNVTAMLLVLVALVSLVNMALGLLPLVGDAPLTLERMLGWIMAPVVWLIGIPWAEAATAGSLMGTKTVLNELIAYLQMKNLPAGALSEHSRLIMVYAMCGFANFGSLGIMLGGLASMVPERRREIAELGLKSVVSGTVATLMTGAVVGILN